jgi:cytoskeletal protein RodZ
MKIDEKAKQDFIKLGLQIKKLREERAITLKDLSAKTNIRKEYLQKIENGKAYGVLIDKHLLKIAIALKVHFAQLFDYE